MAKGTFSTRARVWANRGLAAAGGAHEQDVALLELHVVAAAEVDALVVVIYRHRQGHLGSLLADDILVQHLVDLPGGGDGVGNLPGGGVLDQVALVLQDAHAQLDALVADIGAGAGDEPADLILVLAAEGTADGALFVVFCHESLTS